MDRLKDFGAPPDSFDLGIHEEAKVPPRLNYLNGVPTPTLSLILTSREETGHKDRRNSFCKDSELEPNVVGETPRLTQETTKAYS